MGYIFHPLTQPDENSAVKETNFTLRRVFSLVGYLAKEACNKKSHTWKPATATMSRRNKRRNVYYCLSIKSREEEEKEEEEKGGGFHGTWREKFFNFLSESSWSWLEIKKGQVIRRGMGSLYYSTPITTTLSAFPVTSSRVYLVLEETSKNRERVPRGEEGRT